ncbi:TRAP transporter large permease [Halocella sp. SP3-1]|uniref:TRAP transporter large permease n=1 Tax=Halocella sp. SP3-1 TaxID=2382161 RepID=UPI000F74EEF1|nr:TRAP transporter large permease [Halocella sp. SP3-1]AZO93767.1 TRAP transporter large permease [Halocella sp. SP3-1]AZO93775.1 TRAP transporter large permease [Halocella sp. SP3-1]
MIYLLLIAFFVLLISNIPIAFTLLFSSFIFLHEWGMISPGILPNKVFNGINSFPYLAVPFFILAGQLMNKTGITTRLVKFADIVIGKIHGGLAQANILSSIIFAGLTGSGVADTSAVGSILIPAMTEQGFDKDYSAAVTAASSVIGPIIPPSVLMVIYANIVGISVGDLFVAGFIPGVLIGLGLMILAYYFAKRDNHPRRTEAVSTKEVLLTTKDALLAILMPVIIIGGIVGGIFTPTEAAAVAVAYALFVGFFIFRSLKLSDLPSALLESVKTTGTILIIIACAAIFGWALTILRVPSLLAAAITGVTQNPLIVLLFINILLLFVGMIMEIGAAVIILAPILAPLVAQLGIDPLHFAIIMVVNLNIGLATPPLGVCLFVAAPIAKTTLERVSRAILPFLAVEIAVLFLLTYWPKLVLFLPNLLGYGG